MRIKRSSYKKNRDKKTKFFGISDDSEDNHKSMRLTQSNDTRDKAKAMGLKTEEFGGRKMSQTGQQPKNGHHTKYQNLSAQMKTNLGEKTNKIMWDKRFIDLSSIDKPSDLIPLPSPAHLNKILESEKDER
jgi:hypothetical protein